MLPGLRRGVAAILGKVEGVPGVAVDQKATTAKFTAADAKAAQRALDALAAGGFHGDAGGRTMVIDRPNCFGPVSL